MVSTQHRRRLFPLTPGDVEVHSQAAPPLHPRLAVRSEGTGPVVALVPDICSATSQLDEVGDMLVNDLRVIRPHNGGPRVLAVLAKQTNIRSAALAVLEATRPIAAGAVVVGEGAGGLIAAEMARLTPWVQRVALVDTPLTEDAVRKLSSGAGWRVRRRWSGTCRRFLREVDPLIDRLRDLDRPILVIERELDLLDALQRPGTGGRIRFGSARDRDELAGAIASFAEQSHRRKSRRFEVDATRERKPIAA
jgi:pimeloyl-ACP methyl ester carboxylesterase